MIERVKERERENKKGGGKKRKTEKRPTENTQHLRGPNMVQYVFTPWRNRDELLRVRAQFFPDKVQAVNLADNSSSSSSSSNDGSRKRRRTTTTSASAEDTKTARTKGEDDDDDDDDDERKKAVGRVLMWANRGPCPHLVEATAHLMAVRLADEASRGGTDEETMAVALGYGSAFSR